MSAIIFSICREFGVNEKWLRSGEGEMFEELTDQQKILKYTALLLKDKDSAVADAIQTLIVTYEQLDDTSKAVLEKIAKQYIDNLKKEPVSTDSPWLLLNVTSDKYKYFSYFFRRLFSKQFNNEVDILLFCTIIFFHMYDLRSRAERLFEIP